MCSLCGWGGVHRETRARRWRAGPLWPQWGAQPCRHQLRAPWGSEQRVVACGRPLPISWDAPQTASFYSCLLSAGQPTAKNKRQFSTHWSHQTHFIMCASDRECQNCQRRPSDRLTICMTGFNSSPCSHLCVPQGWDVGAPHCDINFLLFNLPTVSFLSSVKLLRPF